VCVCVCYLIAMKQTELANRPDIATFFVCIVVLLFACTKGEEGSPVPVPADCQQFLNKYFGRAKWEKQNL
jgi:hypothetical protein